MVVASSSLEVLETGRLVLRRLTTADAAFILELVNDPDWLRFIGDRGVRNLDDARDYIMKGPMAMYERCGFGLYLTQLRDGGARIGVCGLLKRDSLPDVDLGFALLPAYRGSGYATESASATMAFGRDVLGLGRIVAITNPDNRPSIRLLEKLGFRFEQAFRHADGAEELSLFAA